LRAPSDFEQAPVTTATAIAAGISSLRVSIMPELVDLAVAARLPALTLRPYHVAPPHI
jgi:hypothetical protein